MILSTEDEDSHYYESEAITALIKGGHVFSHSPLPVKESAALARTK